MRSVWVCPAARLAFCVIFSETCFPFVFHFTLHRSQSRPPPPLFSTFSEVYTISPAREYMQILPKLGARWCKVRKCQLFLSVKCDRTTVLINREADTQQITESMNGFWLICNYWFFRLLNRCSLPLPLYFYLSRLTVAGCVLNATVSIIFSCT